MNKQTSELKDLDVDRVDGVDRPATGRNFLLFKSEAGADAILKSLGMVSTAASVALAKMRTDKSCTVSKDTAIALNGVAQILGEAPVFVDKSVPTQPYEIKEDVDVDSRGPADEKLGSNFVARSIGTVKLKMKGDDCSQDEPDQQDVPEQFQSKAAKLAAKVKAAEAVAETAVAAEKSETAELRKMIADLAGVVKKAIEGPVTKAEEVVEEEAEPVRKAAPRSKQVQAADQVQVQKSDLRMGVSFADTVFGGKR